MKRRTIDTKKMILNAILLGIGFILHQVLPALAAGITPDMTLVMLFCIMVINRESYKTCLVSGIITAIFSALATKFPMGQIPNFVDKVVTMHVMYFFMKSLYMLPVMNRIGKKADQIAVVSMTAIGTLVSGVVFLTVAYLMAGLPGGFGVLFVSVVLPTLVFNMVACMVLYNVLSLSLKRSSYQLN